MNTYLVRRLLLANILTRANFYARAACQVLLTIGPDNATVLAKKYQHYMDLYNWAVEWLR